MKRTTVAELENLIRGLEYRLDRLDKKPEEVKSNQPSRLKKVLSCFPTLKRVEGGLLILSSRQAHPEV